MATPYTLLVFFMTVTVGHCSRLDGVPPPSFPASHHRHHFHQHRHRQSNTDVVGRDVDDQVADVVQTVQRNSALTDSAQTDKKDDRNRNLNQDASILETVASILPSIRDLPAAKVLVAEVSTTFPDNLPVAPRQTITPEHPPHTKQKSDIGHQSDAYTQERKHPKKHGRPPKSSSPQPDTLVDLPPSTYNKSEAQVNQRQSTRREDSEAATEVETSTDNAERGGDSENVPEAETRTDAAAPERTSYSRNRPVIKPGDKKLVNRPRWRHIIRQNKDVVDNNDRKTDSSTKKQFAKSNTLFRKGLRGRHKLKTFNRTDTASYAVKVSISQRNGQDEFVNSSQSELNATLSEPGSNESLSLDQSNATAMPDSVEKEESQSSGKDADSSNSQYQVKHKEPTVTRIVKGNQTKSFAKKEKKTKKKRKGVKHGVKSKKTNAEKQKIAKRCPGCSKVETKLAEAREMHKQVLKAQILDKLRLVPKLKKRLSRPKLPEKVLTEQPQHDYPGYDDQYYAKPTQVLLFGRDAGQEYSWKKPRTGFYQFGIRGKVKGLVTSAHLWIYKMKDFNDAQGPQTLSITEVQMSKTGNLTEKHLVARLETRVGKGWLKVDLTRLVKKWSRKPRSPHMLAVRCDTCGMREYSAIFGIKSKFRPLLAVREATENAGRREKRTPCDPTTDCCKFDMTLSFRELGINEVFRPTHIRADYCFGTCNVVAVSRVAHYTHTDIVNRALHNGPYVNNSTMRTRLEPCCVPVVLREASVFYYLNDGRDTQVSIIPNLLVDRCGCA